MSTHAQIGNFHLQRINQDDVQVLSFGGALDSDASCRVDKELVHLLEQKHRRVILELSLLSSATTMSLARLLVCAREFRRHGGELNLAGLSTSLKHVAELAGFDHRINFCAGCRDGIEGHVSDI